MLKPLGGKNNVGLMPLISVAQSRMRIASTWKSCLSKGAGLQVGEEVGCPHVAGGQPSTECQSPSRVRRVSAQAGCPAWVSEPTWGAKNIHAGRGAAWASGLRRASVRGNAMYGAGTLAGSGGCPSRRRCLGR